MKKKVIGIIIAVVLLGGGAFGVYWYMMQSGVDGETPAQPTSESQSQSQSESRTEDPIMAEVNPLTGNRESIPYNRPIAVPVLNNPALFPQSGVGTADIIYEVPTNDGVTSLLCLYANGANLSQIGPIGSLNDNLAGLATPFTPLLLQNGGADIAKKYSLTNLDNQTTQSAFTTQQNKVYATKDSITPAIKQQGISMNSSYPDAFFFTDNNTLSSGSASSLTIPYSSTYSAGFNYDGTQGKYVKTASGAAQMDQNTGVQLGANNLLILYAEGSGDSISLESGMGLYCKDGTYTNIMWSKYSAQESFTFLDEEGSPLNIEKGSTWICMVPNSLKSSVTIQ